MVVHRVVCPGERFEQSCILHNFRGRGGANLYILRYLGPLPSQKMLRARYNMFRVGKKHFLKTSLFGHFSKSNCHVPA